MSAVALAARVVLALALAGAAVGKLRDREHVITQMDALLGARLGTIAAIGVPVAELAIAIALVAVPGSGLPTVAAVVLLLAFTVVLVRAQSQHVPCPCFGGGATASPVGPRAVLRNGVLLALAVLATGNPSGASAAATLGWVVLFGAAALLVVARRVNRCAAGARRARSPRWRRLSLRRSRRQPRATRTPRRSSRCRPRTRRWPRGAGRRRARRARAPNSG